MLAFRFLLRVGVALITEGMHFQIPRGCFYVAIAFSVSVETLR